MTRRIVKALGKAFHFVNFEPTNTASCDDLIVVRQEFKLIYTLMPFLTENLFDFLLIHRIPVRKVSKANLHSDSTTCRSDCSYISISLRRKSDLRYTLETYGTGKFPRHVLYFKNAFDCNIEILD